MRTLTHLGVEGEYLDLAVAGRALVVHTGGAAVARVAVSIPPSTSPSAWTLAGVKVRRSTTGGEPDDPAGDVTLTPAAPHSGPINVREFPYLIIEVVTPEASSVYVDVKVTMGDEHGYTTSST